MRDNYRNTHLTKGEKQDDNASDADSAAGRCRDKPFWKKMPGPET